MVWTLHALVGLTAAPGERHLRPTRLFAMLPLVEFQWPYMELDLIFSLTLICLLHESAGLRLKTIAKKWYCNQSRARNFLDT